ncbi:meiotically up-regulated gene family-domain-containing protein [Mycena leptocephala]|nr:meiotically up-regulated gene family-domain-containing protein [Mycena leptocephala]
MHSSIIKAAFLAALSAAVGAAEVTLWNGSANVSVTIDRALEPISKRDSINCKGSTLCSGPLISANQCQAASELIDPSATYVAGGSSSGACFGQCGVFVQSYDGTGGCSVSGETIIGAFDDIRADGCAKCGSYEFDDGCEVTINYVETCNS